MAKGIGAIGRGLLFIAASFIPGLAAGVATFFSAVGINSIIGGVVRALTPNPKRPISSVKATAVGGTTSLPVVYGTRRVGGHLAYLGVSGTNNEYLHYVLAHSLTPSCGVEDITDVHFDGNTVADADINGSGIITSGDYAGWAEVRRVLGTSSDVVDTVLNASFSEIDSNFTGKGLAKTYFRFYRNTADDPGFQAVFPRGIPVCTVLLKGQKCYDPRLDSTNGGSGSHRYTDNTTWAYSANPALCTAHFAILASKLRNGGGGGCGLDPATEVEWPSVAAAANICDETRTIPDGLGGSTTQVRYECHAVINTADDLSSNLDKLVSSMSGQWVITGGKLHLYAGAYSAPVATVDESWLAGHPTYTPRMPIESLWNAVRGPFDNAAANYRTEYATPYTNATYEAQDDNQQLWKDVQHFCTTNQYQAQYLQVILGRRSRMQKQVSAPLNMRGRDLKVWDTVTVSLTEFGLNQVFRVTDLDNQPDGCLATFVEESSTVYSDALTDYTETNAPSTPSVVDETPPTPTNLGASAASQSIVLTWTPPPLNTKTVIYSSDTSGGTFASIGEIEGSVYVDRVAGGVTRYYKVKHRWFNTLSAFSSEVSATALAASAFPLWISSGTADDCTDDGAGEFSGLAPSYPASIAVGDMLWLQVGAQANVGLDEIEVDTPSGWTLKNLTLDGTGRNCQAIYYKRAAGTESGTVSIAGRFLAASVPTTGASNVALARIHRFTGAIASGDPTDGYAATASAASTTITAQNVTTTVDSCLVCQFVYIGEDDATSSFTGESGIDYAEVATSSTTVGGDIAIQLQTGEKDAAGAITGGSFTIATSQVSIKHGFGLKPAA